MGLIKTKKKVYTLFAVVLIGISLLVGCGDGKNTNTNSGNDTNINPNDDVLQQSENQETENQGEIDNITKLENVVFKVPSLQEYLDFVAPLIETESDIDEYGFQDCFDASGQIVSAKQYDNGTLKFYLFYEYGEDGNKKIKAKYETDGSLVFYDELDADEWEVRGAGAGYNEDKGYYIINYSAPGVKEQKNYYYADGTVHEITYYKNDITQKIIAYDESGAEEYTEIYEYANATDMRPKTITTQYAKDGFYSVEDFTTGDTTYYDAAGNVVDYSDYPH